MNCADADLKLIYSAFTKLPSVVVHAAGLQDEVIEEMAGSGPLDTAVPLKVFKSLQVSVPLDQPIQNSPATSGVDARSDLVLPCLLLLSSVSRSSRFRPLL